MASGGVAGQSTGGYERCIWLLDDLIHDDFWSQGDQRIEGKPDGARETLEEDKADCCRHISECLC